LVLWGYTGGKVFLVAAAQLFYWLVSASDGFRFRQKLFRLLLIGAFFDYRAAP